jgi:uncharacterized protein YndB with AHSA1/START domain
MLTNKKAFSSFAVPDLEAARRFYGETLGLHTSLRDGMLMLQLDGDQDVLVYPKPDHVPANFTILNFPVEDLESAVRGLSGRGVRFDRYPGFQQDELGIARGGGPDIAWFRDPAGNILAVLEDVEARTSVDGETASSKLGVTRVGDRQIRTERVFDAPRERVWRAHTEPDQIARWWGRGNRLVVERMEVERGGHWRFVEHGPDGVHGFEGRFREVEAPERVDQTFEWDGMPGHVAVNTATFEDLGNGRTRVRTVSLFHTAEERDGMLNAGMAQGLSQSYEALDRLLAGEDQPALGRPAPHEPAPGLAP